MFHGLRYLFSSRSTSVTLQISSVRWSSNDEQTVLVDASRPWKPMSKPAATTLSYIAPQLCLAPERHPSCSTGLLASQQQLHAWKSSSKSRWSAQQSCPSRRTLTFFWAAVNAHVALIFPSPNVPVLSRGVAPHEMFFSGGAFLNGTRCSCCILLPASCHQDSTLYGAFFDVEGLAGLFH